MASRDTRQQLDQQRSRWPHRLAWALAAAVFATIWAGGTVTTYDAGMAVPDWPTTYGYWFYPITSWLATWDVFLVYGERLLAELTALLAIVLAVVLWRLDGRKWMRWVGAALVLGVIAQMVLGGLRVLGDDRLLARVHGCTASLYFALCVATVVWTSRRWTDLSVTNDFGPLLLWKRVAWLVTAAIYLEIILGAQLRRPSATGGFGMFELWIWLKVINAGLIVGGVAWLLVGLRRAVAKNPTVIRSSQWLALILLVQVGLAAATWVTNYGWPVWFTRWIWPLQSAVVAQGCLQVLLTTAHTAVGSLTLAVSLSLALWLGRLR